MTWRTFTPPEARPTDAVLLDNPARRFFMAKTLDAAKETARQMIAASRFALETEGVTVGGTVIKTDRESQATLSAALLTLQRNPAAVIDWKGDNGWVQIGKAQVEAIADIVSSHVQACFTAEKARNDALDALTSLDEVRDFDCKVTL